MEIGPAIEWVESHIDHSGWAARSGRTESVHLSLSRMRRLVHLLGDPQERLEIIHVTGTNGKGSTSKMITRLLMAEGLRVGSYSSPHLARYNERFRIDDVDIDDGSLADLLTAMAAAEAELGERLMPFEVLTAAAFTWFAEQRVDVAVIEVGVLGRFDATNVGDGRVCVVTNIGFDHTNGEGDWQLRIAEEKAGIVKPGSHVILGPLEPRLEQPFLTEQPAHVWRLGREFVITADVGTAYGRKLSVATPRQVVADIELPLHGAHQAANCAVALAATNAFFRPLLHPGHVTSALSAVYMPARMEEVAAGPNHEGPTVILDGAHNPDAAAALASALHTDTPRTGRRTLIIGLLAGRDPAAMLTAIEMSQFDEVIACTPPTARARPARELVEAAGAMGCSAQAIDDVGIALERTLAASAAADQIVVTGSIYLVADARAWLSAMVPLQAGG